MASPTFSFRVQWSDSDDGKLADELQVTSFEGKEHISECFRFTINLVSRSAPAEYNTIFERRIELRIKYPIRESRGQTTSIDKSAVRSVFGMAWSFEMTNYDGQLYHYRIVMVPRFWRATQAVRNTVHCEKGLWDVIADTISSYNAIVVDYDNSSTLDPTHDFTMQYRESNLDFIQRWLEYYGISYYFTQDATDLDKVRFVNDKSSFPAVNLGGSDAVPYVRGDGDGANEQECIDSLGSQYGLTPNSFRIIDFDPTDPTEPIINTYDIGSPGTGDHVELDNDVRSKDASVDMETIMQVRTEAEQCRTEHITGTGSVRAFSAGHTIKIADNPVGGDNDQYLIVTVTHKGIQSVDVSAGTATGAKYTNSFRAIPNTVTYRPQRNTKRPQIAGLLPGYVECPDAQDAPGIDQYGRYKVRFFLDTSASDSASAWIQKLEPYSGKNRGMHLLLPNGTAVMVGFIAGNPDRPYIVGSVPVITDDLDNNSVGLNTNAYEGAIRTEGARIHFSDSPGSESIFINAHNTMAGVHVPVMHEPTISVGSGLGGINSWATINSEMNWFLKSITAGYAIGNRAGKVFNVSVGFNKIMLATVALQIGVMVKSKLDHESKRDPSNSYVAPLIFSITQIFITMIVTGYSIKQVTDATTRLMWLAKSRHPAIVRSTKKTEKRWKQILQSTVKSAKLAPSFLKNLLKFRSIADAISQYKEDKSKPADPSYGVQIFRSEKTGTVLECNNKGEDILIATSGGSIDIISKDSQNIFAKDQLIVVEDSCCIVGGASDMGIVSGGDRSLLSISGKHILMNGPGRDENGPSAKLDIECAEMAFRYNSGLEQENRVRMDKYGTHIEGKGAYISGRGGKDEPMASGAAFTQGSAVIFAQDDGDIIIYNDKGCIRIDKKGVSIYHTDPSSTLSIDSPGKVTIEAGKGVSIQSSKIELEAPSIDIKGGSLKINGQAFADMGGSAKPPTAKPRPPKKTLKMAPKRKPSMSFESEEYTRRPVKKLIKFFSGVLSDGRK